MEFDEVVRKRRMVRRFEHRQVREDVLRDILGKALHAPSAGFSQGFELVVLRHPADVDLFNRMTCVIGPSGRPATGLWVRPSPGPAAA